VDQFIPRRRHWPLTSAICVSVLSSSARSSSRSRVTRRVSSDGDRRAGDGATAVSFCKIKEKTGVSQRVEGEEAGSFRLDDPQIPAGYEG